jgi:hypothetical protein
MHRFMLTAGLIAYLVASSSSFADIVVFADGTQMEVSHYVIKGAMVLLTTPDGKLLSVPLAYVDMEATARENRGAEAPSTPAREAQPEASRQPASRQPSPPVENPPAALSEPALSPLVWTDEELGVSLVAPSGDWQMPPMTASADVAVQLTNPRTEARATLALIRQRMRNYNDFQKAAREIEDSLVAASSYQILGAGPLSVEPYTAYELRFSKDVQGVSFFYRVVVFYSRDLAYALSMSCPEEKLEENETEFEGLIQGLVIKKTRKDITPKGAPRG